MGAVYRAFDTVLSTGAWRSRCCTRTSARGSKGEQGTERIPSGEARAAAALRHPNAVAIFDLGEHEGVAFIAMELSGAGRSLREAMRARRQEHPLDRRLRWIVEIGRALRGPPGRRRPPRRPSSRT